MHARSGLIIISALCMGLAALASPAAKAGDLAVGDGQTESDLQAVEQQLTDSEGRRKVVSSEVDALSAEARDVQAKLIAAAASMQAREAAISQAEERVAAIAAKQEALTRRLNDRRDAIASLLAGLQRLEMNPPPALAVRPDDATAALRGAMQLGAIIPDLQSQLAALTQDLARLEDLKRAAASEQDMLRAAIAGQKSARLALELLLERKNALLADANGRLAEATERSTALAAKARSIKDFLARLDEEKATLASAADAPPDAETAAPAQAQPDAPAQDTAELPPGPRPQAGVAFSKLAGKLAWPVQGKLLRGFGADDGYGGTSRGLSLETRAQAAVIAPADGRVEFAGEFRSYGQLLILDAGEGYHLLMAGLGRIDVKSGETVRAGEPVAVMGDAPAHTEMSGDLSRAAGPVIYLEIRKHGDAIDPGRWWSAGAKEARN